ncbi:MAG TPA: hypothetical protein VFZ40_01675 [Pyrinomonadaceae bacterium]
MDKDELMELADNPNFISGIHNYCDRWCERCQFTSRCAVYAIEQADPDSDDSQARDITNEKFWRKLHEIFQATADMIVDWAAKNGVDLDSMDCEGALAEHDREVEEAERDELSQAAHAYAGSVEAWFKHEFTRETSIYDDTTGASESEADEITVADAIEVIRWYQFFIAVKTFRAISGSNRFAGQEVEDEALSFDCFSDEAGDDEDLDFDAVLARSAKIDSHGSAKVALVAIARSAAAWRSLQISLPEKSDTIQPLLVELDQLRRSLEARFPRVREFIRPGFDELITEFVS